MPLILTEADIMDRLEQLANSSFLPFFITFLGCFNPGETIRLSSSSSEINLFKKIIIYQDSPFSGLVYEMFPSSNDTLWSCQYKNGIKDGVWKKYFQSGEIKETRLFKQNKKEGDYLGFYKDGSKNFVFQFKNGEYEGTNKVWAKGGVLVEEANFSAGYENGVQKRWYLNGKIKSNYIIKDNRRYGLLGTKNCVTVSDSLKKS